MARLASVVVRVAGEDAAAYLEDVTSQRLADLEVGEARPALVLEANGEPVAAYDIVLTDDGFLLIAPDAATAAHALETMASRTFLLDVRFSETDLAVVAVRGTEPLDAAGTVATIPRPHGVDVVTDDPETLLGSSSPVDDPDRVLADWDITWGVPRWGHEVTPPHLPEEMGLLPTHVHLKKGCYPGQEAVARMWNLGRPRRRLVRVAIEGSAAEGAETGSGQERVTVTGVSSTDPTVGLAFVGRDAEVGDVLDVEGARLTITHVVGADRDVPGHDPAATRRRDQR